MSAIRDAMADDIAREDAIVEKIEALAKRIKEHRRALGLSADNYGRLLRVSGLSVYCWESAKSYPKDHVVDRIERFIKLVPDQKTLHSKSTSYIRGYLQ